MANILNRLTGVEVEVVGGKVAPIGMTGKVIDVSQSGYNIMVTFVGTDNKTYKIAHYNVEVED